MLLLIHARIEEVQQELHYKRGLPNKRMERPRGLQKEMERPQGLQNKKVKRPQGLPKERMRGHQLTHFPAGDGPIEHNLFTRVSYSVCKYISKLLSLTN